MVKFRIPASMDNKVRKGCHSVSMLNSSLVVKALRYIQADVVWVT